MRDYNMGEWLCQEAFLQLCSEFAIVEARGLPGEVWGNNLPGEWANYVEAQVWNREALKAYWQGRNADG